jgi:hypothetical protein
MVIYANGTNIIIEHYRHQKYHKTLILIEGDTEYNGNTNGI